MSRIGKKPIEISSQVTMQMENQMLTVKGSKGSLTMKIHEDYNVRQEGTLLYIAPVKDQTPLWGTLRTCVSNMVKGVSEGFRKDLEFNGVGYKASVTGTVLTLNLGYSHPIEYLLPNGIECKVTKSIIELYGSDKVLLGKTAADIRNFRKPEPYKGKGIRYIDEVIIRKAGKSGGKK